MKRCPECRRDYFDDSLLYCLDDGELLLDGPGSDELVTEILPNVEIREKAATRRLNRSTILVQSSSPDSPDRIRHRSNLWRRVLLSVGLVVLLVAGVEISYRYLLSSSEVIPAELVVPDISKDASLLYWQMSDVEQRTFVRERSRYVFTMIGDEPTELDEAELSAIVKEIDSYVSRKDSLSQKSFEEGLRLIFGRATQYVPMVAKAYEARQVSPALGAYQAMIESEYRDCELQDLGAGLFQFSKKTAAKYGLQRSDYCNVQKQSDAAARYMSDLMSDFSGRSSAGLGLFAFNSGENNTRDRLRDLRSHGIAEHSFWAILSHEDQLQEPLTDQEKRYVPRFFAAAIIGETPRTFDLSTPPLMTLSK